jgi:hypothetical protein
MLLLAAATDAHVWACDALAELDAALVASGATLLRLPWERWELEEDGEHLVARDFAPFARELARLACDALPPARPTPGAAPRRALLLTDSSVAQYGEPAARLVRALFAERGVDVEVDAVCGSGFVAGPTFGERLRRWAARGGGEGDVVVVVVVGGWNDVAHAGASAEQLRASARRLAWRAGAGAGAAGAR